jgi:NhaP-type Na+/H+ or K+/H+ antiporter
MSTMVEAFLVAAIAGMVAGVSVGWINRKILKFKKRKKIFKRQWSKWARDSSADVDANVEPS